MREIAATPTDALVRLIDEPVELVVTGSAGHLYRSKTYSFWDTEPWQSELFIRTKITGRGIRGFQRYYGVEVRSPETRFSREPGEVEVRPTWTEVLAWVCVAAFTVALSAALLVGALYVVSLVL
ncbi:MAG: hypothetical protein ACRDT7_15585 [Microbacterium sp.]